MSRLLAAVVCLAAAAPLGAQGSATNRPPTPKVDTNKVTIIRGREPDVEYLANMGPLITVTEKDTIPVAGNAGGSCDWHGLSTRPPMPLPGKASVQGERHHAKCLLVFYTFIPPKNPSGGRSDTAAAPPKKP